MEDFYREARRRTGVLVEADGEPTGGRWNYDADNREPPPKGAVTLGVDEPWWPEEDDIDAQVRADLDAWEARGPLRGPGRPATLRGHRRGGAAPPWRTSSPTGSRRSAPTRTRCSPATPGWRTRLLSAPLNLGLLDPVESWPGPSGRTAGRAPLASVEGFVRQVIGWREYVWHLYWHLDAGYRDRNALGATEATLPDWFADLDAVGHRANCLSHILDDVARHGWAHHIPRLMILGSYALQRGWDPAEVTDWFHRSFVDGYDWVMVPNVVGMSQHADGGVMATKPYTSGGAYLSTDDRLLRRLPAGPEGPGRGGRLPVHAPATGGSWTGTGTGSRGNHRMSRAVAGLGRLSDLEALVEQETARGSQPP